MLLTQATAKGGVLPREPDFPGLVLFKTYHAKAPSTSLSSGQALPDTAEVCGSLAFPCEQAHPPRVDHIPVVTLKTADRNIAVMPTWTEPRRRATRRSQRSGWRRRPRRRRILYTQAIDLVTRRPARYSCVECLRRLDEQRNAAIPQPRTSGTLRRATECTFGAHPTANARAASRTQNAGTGAELAIEVRLANGSKVDPSQILSEASLDLLALLILVEVHIECARLGQNQIIILDDIFQSVDSVNRIRALDHVLSRLKTWQVVITLHDRLWLELTRKAMGRIGHQFIDQEILAGDFGESPRLREASGRSAEDLLTYMNRRESSGTITGCAGRVLEELCDVSASHCLPVYQER